MKASQKAFLRSRARMVSPAVRIGRAGLTDAVLAHIGHLLDQRELVKVRMGQAPEGRRAAAEALAGTLRAELIDVIGGMVVLYRRGDRLPAGKQIPLPD